MNNNEALERATTHLVEKFNHLVDGAEKMAPHVYDMALNVITFSCLSNLIVGFLFLIFSGLFLLWSKIIYKHDDCDPLIVVSLFGFAICSLIMAIRLFDIWNWVGVFKPELWLAHSALNKVL